METRPITLIVQLILIILIKSHAPNNFINEVYTSFVYEMELLGGLGCLGCTAEKCSKSHMWLKDNNGKVTYLLIWNSKRRSSWSCVFGWKITAPKSLTQYGHTILSNVRKNMKLKRRMSNNCNNENNHNNYNNLQFLP